MGGFGWPIHILRWRGKPIEESDYADSEDVFAVPIGTALSRFPESSNRSSITRRVIKLNYREEEPVKTKLEQPLASGPQTLTPAKR